MILASCDTLPRMSYLPRYQAVPTSDDGDGSANASPELSRRLRRIIRALQIIFVVALIYAVLDRFSSIAWGATCHSNALKTIKPPPHYTLPNGDKIPAVALGIVNPDFGLYVI